MYIQTYGDKTNPTILFIHGAMFSGWMWQPQVEALSGEFHCLVPDMPEHGNNRSEELFTIREAAQQLADLIREQGRDGQASVVGLSLGGTVALELLRLAPEVVEKAMVSAASIGPFPGGSLMGLMKNILVPLTKSNFGMRQTAKTLKIPADLMPQYSAAMQALTPDMFGRINSEIHGYRIAPEMSKISVPILAGCGSQEPRFVRHNQLKIIQILANTRGFLAPDVNHGWNMEAPDLFNRTVKAWLTDQPLPDALGKL